MTLSPYLDTLDVWGATAALPEQLRDALVVSRDVVAAASLPDPASIDSVLLLGEGTGAQACRVAAAYSHPRASVPVGLCADTEMPAFVRSRTLVFVVTHAGDAERFGRAAREAHERGALVVVVSSEGSLTDWAADAGLTVFGVVPDVPVARTALGAMTVPVLVTMAHLGLLPDVVEPLGAAIDAVGRRRDALLAPSNAAERVARTIGRTLPLVYGASGMGEVAARRWKTQINENAKVASFFGSTPEVAHGEVAGWGQNGDVTRQVFTLVTLRHDGETPEMVRQFDRVVEATDEVMADVITVRAEGAEDLSRFFDLALFGDFVSLHLAGREETDPGPVPTIEDVGAR